ncbi:MAG: aminotransferase class III-fold pyridoxal phosphate-dependent enzyme [Planctomycetaceae bacterium]
MTHPSSLAAGSQIEARYCEKFPKSARLYQRGMDLFPSGVTHDARYMKPFPIYATHALGSKKYDVDDNEIIDFWTGHGALLLGHSHPAVVEAVQKQVALSTHPGACHEGELEWGELIRKLVPSCERLRFTNSGTEATLMALRVARIVTGKSKVIKFAGMFHGWHDQLLPAAEPPHKEPTDYTQPGVTDGVFGDLVIVPPNDLEAVAKAIEEHDPACVFHEGNGSRWGVVPARQEFLQGLQKLTREKKTIFILDEVITGFRVAPGGVQETYGLSPDLTTMAKVVAGGLPGGCLGGREDLMQVLAFDNPLGKKMKHPGTYNANPLSAAAGIAALNIVATGEPCDHANNIARELRGKLNRMFAEKSASWVAYGDFSAIKIHPEYDGPRPDSDDFIPFNNDYRKLDRKFDPQLSHAFRCALLLGGVDWMGWGGSTSAAHSSEDVDRTVAAFSQAIDLLREDGLTA